MIVSRFTSERDTSPQRVEDTWAELVESLCSHAPTACTLATCARAECPQKKIRAWSPASWPPGAARRRATVEAVSCLVIDLDHVPPDELGQVLARFAAYDHVMHASHSDCPTDRCVRVVVRLSRPVPGPDWPRFWRAAIDMLEAPADEACKDPSRLYYLPSRPSDAEFDYATNDGAPIDVDVVLAAAPPVPVTAPTPVEIPAFKGAPDAEAYEAAVEALGAAWAPHGQRHVAQLALAGALTRAGWPVELVARFAHDVAEAAEPGNGDLPKRLGAARSSRDKLEAGDAIVGWPTLEQYVAPEAVATAMRSLRLGVPDEDPAFMAGFQAILERRRERAPIPTRLELRTALERVRDVGKKAKTDKARLESKLLARVLKGEFLTDRVDEDRERTLALAALAVVQAAPTGTPPALIHELLFGPAGELACQVPEMVADAIAHAARPPQIETVAPEDRLDPEDEALCAKLTLTDKGRVDDSPDNIERILHYSKALGDNMLFNPRTRQTKILDGRFVIEDPDTLALGVRNWLSSHWKLRTSIAEVADQLFRVARLWFSHDPVEGYFRRQEWDHVPRIDTWLTRYCRAEDTPYVRAVGARFLISAVARTLKPGCKVDTMLVLEGKQGVGKSTVFSILGGEWFADTALELGSKDSRLLIAQKLIVEFSELASLGKGEVDNYKQFLSQCVDDFRPPYGRAIVAYPRRCVCVGTVNRDDWLQDPTGNRRYWAVRTGRCDTDALKRDRDQLWAEATYRYLHADIHPELAHPDCPGERYWFAEDEQIEADAVAEERRLEDPWAERIGTWLDQQLRPVGANPPRKQFTLNEIATEALEISIQDTRHQTRKIAEAMREAGMERVKTPRGAPRVWTRRTTPRSASPAVDLRPDANVNVN